jgi:antitoxin HicB
MSKKHLGSSIDDFLKEEGIFEDAQAQVVEEVVARQLAEGRKAGRRVITASPGKTNTPRSYQSSTRPPHR